MALIGVVVKAGDYFDAARRRRRFLSDFFMPPSGRDFGLGLEDFKDDAINKYYW